MNYITTTELRTKSTKLVESLKKGEKVSLMHRSKVVGIIAPAVEPKPFTEDVIKKLKKLAQELNLPKTSYKERERIYRKHLTQKYGEGLS